jgi:hypothetical protein
MSRFVDLLQMLNRKERFFLVGFALDNQQFALGVRFRELLQAEFHVEVPEDAFVAMDYHFSWLYAAAVLSQAEGLGPFPSGGGIERGNQEDIDLLVAFDDEAITRVLILEAKGVTGWNNRQLRSKLERLASIFGTESNPGRFPFLRPDFAILSPIRPIGVDTTDWPGWMTDQPGRPHWIEMPAPGDLLKVTRCDSHGKTAANGGYWMAEHDRVSARLHRNPEPEG